MKRLTLFIQIALIACNSVETKKENISYPESYTLEVSDTFRLHYIARLIKPLDYNTSTHNILFGSYTLDTIVQTDDKGTILNKFVFKGDGPEESGRFIHNIGYYNDTSILVNSERGFYFYSLEGKLLKFISERTPLKAIGSATDTRIREFSHAETPSLFLHLKAIADLDTRLLFTPKNLALFRALTAYNLTSSKHQVLFGFEPGSMLLKQSEYHYGEPENIFDYNYPDQSLNIIHNPEAVLYKYMQADNFSTFKPIALHPEHFKLPVRYPASAAAFDLKYASVNSQFKDLNCAGPYTFITYKTGIPEKEYNKITTDSEMPGLYKKHMKYYTILLRDDVKIAADIELPDNATGISFVKSPDYIFVRTNPAITETEDATIFLICKLKKNEN